MVCLWFGWQVLEELQKDPWAVPADQRAARCTSTALSIAASLLGACVPGSAARIMAFIGGPATEGPAPVRATHEACVVMYKLGNVLFNVVVIYVAIYEFYN